jgi:hypothetical protein
MASAFLQYAIFGAWYVFARFDRASSSGAGGSGRLRLPGVVRAICDG